ncbi:MAG: NAD-dependent epimerase/dehydratase family protein [Actinomycetota bacterium]
MKTFAITGISGYLGQQVLARLDSDSRVDKIIGFDVVAPKHSSTKLEFYQLDIRDARLVKMLTGVDALVHLAFVVDPIRDEEKMRSINIEGTENVIDAAARAPVTSLVFPSTAGIYGAHADNDLPLTESSPMRPNADIPYAMHAMLAESIVKSLRASNVNIPVTVLRMATVMGAHAENFFCRMFESPRLVFIKGHSPPLQVIHESDAARAIVEACFARWDEDLNCAADGWMEQDEMVALTGKRIVEIPEALAFSLAERAWKMRLTSAPASELSFLMHPLVLDSSKIRSLGWRPRYSNREALIEMIRAHSRWISFGNARFTKGDLAKGAAATLGVLASAAAIRRSRRSATKL